MAPRQGDDPLGAARESRHIEFKDQFSPDVPGAWCELIKDVIAMANSGGGTIVLGLTSTGVPSGWNAQDFLAIDPAEVVNQVSRFLSEPFTDLQIDEAQKDGKQLAMLIIAPRIGHPLVFEKAGTYRVDAKTQKTAFARGTVYFRHGAKSEPATSADLAKFIQAELARQRAAWLKNIRKIARASKEAEVIVVDPKAGPSGTVDRFRVVDDPTVPAVARTDYDVTHPYRQKELLVTINKRMAQARVGRFEILCVRRTYGIDDKEEFVHKPKYSQSPQFSDAFVSWLMTEYQRDSQFFEKAKDSYRALRQRD